MFVNPHTLGIFSWGEAVVSVYLVDGHPQDFAVDTNNAYHLDDIFYGRVVGKDSHFYWVDVGLDEPLALKRRSQTYNDGDNILVQISRLAMHDEAATRGIKNIKLTDNIHLFGHFCAYHPNKTGFYKSPEIPTPLANAIKPTEYATFRHTVIDEACLEKAYNEFDSLKDCFETLRHFQKIGLVHKALSPIGRMIRDIPQDTDIVVEEPALAVRYKPILNTLRPDLISRMHMARENEKPLITFLGIEDVWHSLLSPRVECPHGISIHIYEAPAATLIDVNSGPSRSDEANSIAAKYIFEHIKWRQLGGAILVDFVDSHSARERKKLEDYLKKLAQEFKLESLSILGWSHLRLYELSHPRRGESLTKTLAGLKS